MVDLGSELATVNRAILELSARMAEVETRKAEAMETGSDAESWRARTRADKETPDILEAIRLLIKAREKIKRYAKDK